MTVPMLTREQAAVAVRSLRRRELGLTGAAQHRKRRLPFTRETGCNASR